MAMEQNKWNDISVEEWREYVYSDHVLRVEKPKLLHVSPSSMGGHAHRIQAEDGTAYYVTFRPLMAPLLAETEDEGWNPVANISDAFMLLDALKLPYRIDRLNDGSFTVEIAAPHTTVSAHDPDLCRAITLAALRAAGESV